MTRYRFVSTVKLGGMTIGDLVTAATELEAVLFDDAVLASPKVVALPDIDSVTVEGIVESNPSDVATAMALEAAIEAWSSALGKCHLEPLERSGMFHAY